MYVSNSLAPGWAVYFACLFDSPKPVGPRAFELGWTWTLYAWKALSCRIQSEAFAHCYKFLFTELGSCVKPGSNLTYLRPGRDGAVTSFRL